MLQKNVDCLKTFPQNMIWTTPNNSADDLEYEGSKAFSLWLNSIIWSNQPHMGSNDVENIRRRFLFFGNVLGVLRFSCISLVGFSFHHVVFTLKRRFRSFWVLFSTARPTFSINSLPFYDWSYSFYPFSNLQPTFSINNTQVLFQWLSLSDDNE